MFPFIISLFNKMNFTARFKNVLSALKGDNDALLTEIASLKDQLATALANDVADAQASAAAQASAEVARALATAAVAETIRLQNILDANATEDASLEALLDSLEAPAAPVVEEVSDTEETTED
jgi:DNA polymerase I-like protein with 3'-5' exonuclease and polymerase domains